MDFFDNALNTAKEAIEIVSKKTEEVVTTGKQKFNIASLENQCSKTFKALGEIYYNQIKNSEIEDDEIKAIVNSITQKQEEINKLKAELEASK